MNHRIVQKKLLLLHHIANLEDDSLAKQVYTIQSKLLLPGLVQECQKYLVQFEVIDLTKFTKTQWKNLVRQKIYTLNRDNLLHKMKSSYKKLDHKLFENEKFEQKSYLSDLHLDQARCKFRLRSFMTKTVKMNFPSDKIYKLQLWKCWHCDNIDTQSHIRHCPAYEHLRLGKDMNNDNELVTYIKQVIAFREIG